MAQALGISDRMQISALEHGRQKTPPEALKKLLEILHKKSLRYPKLKQLQESVALRIGY
jgi:transcriptional regulator with XRE-family HTH domain